eukprot:g17629.t1
MTLEDGLVLARSGMHSSMNYRCVMVHGKAEEQKKTSEGWASQLRPMTSAEVQSTRVLKLKLEDGKVSAKVRAEGANDDKEERHGDPHSLAESEAGVPHLVPAAEASGAALPLLRPGRSRCVGGAELRPLGLQRGGAGTAHRIGDPFWCLPYYW